MCVIYLLSFIFYSIDPYFITWGAHIKIKRSEDKRIMLRASAGLIRHRIQIFDRSFTPILPLHIYTNMTPSTFLQKYYPFILPPPPENTQCSLAMPALNSTTNGTVQHPAELDVNFFVFARSVPQIDLHLSRLQNSSLRRRRWSHYLLLSLWSLERYVANSAVSLWFC